MTVVKIENVRVLDPIHQTDAVQTVYIENGKLVAETANAVSYTHLTLPTILLV